MQKQTARTIRVCRTVVVFAIVFFGFFGFVKFSEAAVDLPWSTTFNCPEWSGPVYDGAVICGDVTRNGNYPTTLGAYDQIIAAANYSDGAGGNGRRQWIGNDTSVSIGTKVQLNVPTSEIWIRWYQRYQTGMTMGSYHKELYLKNISGNNINAIDLVEGDAYAYYEQAGGVREYWTKKGFESYFCNANESASNGTWHGIEIHLKSETSSGARDGELDFWIDGEPQLIHDNIITSDRYHVTTVNHGLYNNPIAGISIGDNVRGFSQSQDMFTDYDDIAIFSTTPGCRDVNGRAMIGPIGCAESGDETSPNAPNGLSVN